jgi:hypothetical protein
MEATKTTFYLPNTLRARLKTLGAVRRKTVTELLREGAELVLARHQGDADQDELRRRAAAARAELRRGLYSGRPLSNTVDELVYGKRPRPPLRVRAKR